jgi:hypothetical protein
VCIPGAAGTNSKEGSWAQWLTQDPKGERDNRMPGKRRSGSDVRAEASRGPRDRRRLDCLKPNVHTSLGDGLRGRCVVATAGLDGAPRLAAEQAVDEIGRDCRRVSKRRLERW